MSGDRFDSTTLIVQRLGAIEGKLDENNSMTGEIRVSVAQHSEILKAQHESLVEHIRRTKNLEDRIKPIETHIVRIDGAVKFVGLLALIVGVVASVLKLTSG